MKKQMLLALVLTYITDTYIQCLGTSDIALSKYNMAWKHGLRHGKERDINISRQ